MNTATATERLAELSAYQPYWTRQDRAMAQQLESAIGAEQSAASAASVGDLYGSFSLAVETEVVREKFAAMGYERSANDAQIDYRYGAYGLGFYLHIPNKMGGQDFTIYFDSDANDFYFVLPSMTDQDNSAANVSLDQIPYDGETSSLQCGRNHGAAIPLNWFPVEPETMVETEATLSPSHVAALQEQLQYWQDQRRAACMDYIWSDVPAIHYDWSRFDLCSRWIAAIEGIIALA